MSCQDQNTDGLGEVCIQWWQSFAAEARARALESLDQRPAVSCPCPPLGITRLMLLATLFQQQE
jgi:hypothetical protein